MTLLSVVCLTVAGFHLLRLAVVRVDPVGEAAHAAMGLGMAAMFSPLGDPVPVSAWVSVFVLSGAWFAALALRTPGGTLRSAAVHHVVGAAAMLVMLLGTPADDDVAGHAGHVGHGGGPDAGPGLASVVSIVLAGYFVWHVLRCADRLRSVTPAPGPAGAVAVRAPVLRDVRAVAAAHVAMAAAMAVMLLGVV